MAFSYRSKAAQFSLAAGGDARAQNTSRHRTFHTPFLLSHPPSEDTRRLAKSYFKLIQAIHHNNIIDNAIATHTPPKGMAKHTARLWLSPTSPPLPLSSWCQQTQQADQEGQWHCGGGAGHFDSSLREEDAVEGDTGDTAVWLSPYIL